MNKIHIPAISMILVTLAANARIQVDFDKIQNWSGEGGNRAALVIQNDGGASDPNVYVFGYRWPEGETRTGEDMLRAVCAHSRKLVLLTQYTGQYGSTVCGIGYGDASLLLDYIYFDFDSAKKSEFINFDYYSTGGIYGQTEAPGDNTPAIMQAAIDKARTDGFVIQHPLDYRSSSYPAYDYDCWLMKDEGHDAGWWTASWYNGYWSYWTASKDADEWMYSGSGFSGRQLRDGVSDAWTYCMFDKPQTGGAGEGTPPSADASKYVYVPETIASSLESVISDTDTPAIYFTLQGVKIAERSYGEAMPALEPGIYIEKRGNVSRKIII